MDKFTFYLLDVSDKIKYFLGELQQRDLEHGVSIEAVDYNLDKALMSWDSIWDYGALALLTDCVYQSMSEYDYTYIGTLSKSEYIANIINSVSYIKLTWMSSLYLTWT